MRENWQICILQPDIADKRANTAKAFCRGRRRNAKSVSAGTSIFDVKQKLKKIRQETIPDVVWLTQTLIKDINQKHPEIKIYQAIDSASAVNYISNNSEDINIISTNNSSVTSLELTPGLRDKGFNVINSYLSEFEVEKKYINDYWDLPNLEQKNLIGTFDVNITINGLVNDHSNVSRAKKYIAVLGANSVSVEDHHVFFLQHFSNISKDLEEAHKVFIVVGLDRILKNMEDAVFQCKCMGIFGMENILLGIQQKKDKQPSIKEMDLQTVDGIRELHVIVLDNGRSKLIGSKHEDIFMCIGCRACNNHCPVRHSFANSNYIWTPRNYLFQFLNGKIESLDVCLHCEACRLECPVDIDLPALMWEAKIDRIPEHPISLYHKILGRPELLAKIGSIFASIANAFVKMKIPRILMEFSTGVDRKTVLPTFHYNTFEKWFNNYEK